MSDKTNVTVKKLENNELIDDACALLYKEYIETDSWVFSSDNPSELKVITKNNRKLLVDRITPHAIWFGAFDNNKIVGCIRIFKATDNVPFEIELYQTAQEIVKQYIEINKPNIYEGSRACVDSDYKGKNILAMLYSNMLEHCQKEKASIFGSTSNGYAKSVLRRIEWPCKKENAFKFEETDTAPVSFYLANDTEISNMIKNVKLLENTRSRRTLNILDALKMVAPIFPAPMYWHDTKGVVLGVNAQGLKGMRKSIEEVLGKTPYDFYPQAVADRIWQNSVQVLKNGETLTQEEYSYDNSGKCIGTYLAIKAPLYDENGHTLGVLGTSIDITDIKELEQELVIAKNVAEESNAIKGEFIENMQHDLRTPAHGVCSGLADLLKSESDPDKQKTLALIYKSAKQLFNLCLEVTDFDKMEHHEKVVTSKKFDLKKLVQNVIELNQTAATKKGLEIVFNINKDVPDVVKGDAYRVKRILINLVGNAIKFTKQGKVSLSVSLLKKFDKEHVLRFEIQDTGIGIPQDKIEFIYEKFTRGTPANRGTYKGIGLGLRLVKGFVEDLGGDIEVQSGLDEGTTFYITLPFDIPLSDDLHENKEQEDELEFYDDDDGIELESPNEQVNVEATDGLQTLLIEDDPLARMAAKNALTGLQCAVATADSVQTAKDILDRIKFDVIVSDIGLPDGTGFDVARYLKSDPKGLNYKTPIFALTAHGGKEKVEEAENVGFLALLTKPLVPKKFKVLLDTHVRKISQDVLLPTAAANNDNEQIIDWEYSKTYGLDRASTMTLMKQLYSELPEEVQQIKEARKKNDIHQIRELLHKFKGGFCYFGVNHLKRATNELHDQVKIAKSLAEIDHLFDAFYKEAERVRQEYERTVKADH